MIYCNFNINYAYIQLIAVKQHLSTQNKDLSDHKTKGKYKKKGNYESFN